MNVRNMDCSHEIFIGQYSLNGLLRSRDKLMRKIWRSAGNSRGFIS